MDSTQIIQVDKSSPETFSDSSLSPDSPDSNDIFGEPLVHPRVGDEYQAEIPCLLNKSNPNSSLSFSMGLPLPVMWIGNQENSIKESMEALNNAHDIYTNGWDKADAPNQTHSLVPGQPSDQWSDFEADCFLLGLYIFGKNLLQVMSFTESKGIGQILAYYYGRFYGSGGYRKWVECRKMRNKKCVLGHRFFTGYRQHELFARLSPRLDEESKAKFLEASRAFVEGSTSLEEYVSSLKSLVGTHALVQAVGIGKGKDDLTTLIFDGTKNNHLFTHRPEIPSGKACSSLSSSEIVKYLTGDFRLSKARSNDLFWEAVWPRLLARGWHSEQPHNDNYPGSKNCLVFLIPGVKKFSRRKLLKGDHYFDSVTDVLAKVASEPELLELDASSKVENGWPMDVKSDDHHDLDRNDDHDRHCYLKPRVSYGISDLFKFTVVDTSLASEDNPFKVRELRSLPLSAKRCSAPKKYDRNSDTMPSESERTLPKENVLKTIKHQFTRRNKPGPTSCSSGQVTKRRRVASSVDRELTYVLGLPARISKIKIKNKNVVLSRISIRGTSDEKILQDQSLTESRFDFSWGKENTGQEPKVVDLNLPQGEPESDGRVKPEVKIESDGELKLEGGRNSVIQQPESKKPEHSDTSVSCATEGPTEKSGEKLDQQPLRRQSTRNRPLTTKALEALEIGFLSPIRQSRKRSSSTSQEQKSKRYSQQREKTSMLPPVVDLEVREAANENRTGKMSEIPETSLSQTASKEMFT